MIDHYENPRNVGSLDKNDSQVGTGIVGAPACGDVMKLQVKINEKGKIIDAKFKTFGCGSAIASSSLATEWVKGKTVSNIICSWIFYIEQKKRITIIYYRLMKHWLLRMVILLKSCVYHLSSYIVQVSNIYHYLSIFFISCKIWVEKFYKDFF